MDGPTGKVLAPALPVLVPALVEEGELPDRAEVIEGLLAMSSATMDRRLRPYRTGLVGLPKGRSMTRPGSLLKSQIPLKTWHEWDDSRPGFLEIDLVAHDGGDNNGPYFHSLNATDVASGWTEAITVRSKGERLVGAGLDELVLRFPFAVLGIHSDNGAEFINDHLLRWTRARQITFTRGRPNHKNDQAYVEQKNWTLVRRSVGYYRYDTGRELELMNQLWPLQTRLFNLLKPQQKLLTKTRRGAKVTKTYDKATSPLARLLRDHRPVLDVHDQRELQHLLDTIRPAGLRREVDLIQRNLTELARRRGEVKTRAKRNHVYLSRTKITVPTKGRTHEGASSDQSTTPLSCGHF